MKFNINKQFKDLAGTELKGDENNMAKVLANALYYTNSGKSLKGADWAFTLFKTGVIELDENDFELIMAFVQKYGIDMKPGSNYVQNLFFDGHKAQLIQLLKNQKDKIDKK